MDRKRLVFFILGTVAGSVLVYFILIKGKKFPAWLPEDRVKDQIQGTRIELTPKATCIINCINSTPQEIGGVIADGEVMFSKSDTRKKPYPIYRIEGKTTTGVSLAVFTETNSKTQITKVINIDLNEKSQLQKCSCDSL
jgi:hypothetical protein